MQLQLPSRSSCSGLRFEFVDTHTHCSIFLPSPGFVFLEGLVCLLFTTELALRIPQQQWAFVQDRVKAERVKNSTDLRAESKVLRGVLKPLGLLVGGDQLA